LGTVFPNSGNYGAPIALFAYGTAAFDYAIIIMVIHGLIQNTLGIFIASYGSEKSTSIKEALINTIKMTVLYGVILGILFQFLHLILPSTIRYGISMLGAASILCIADDSYHACGSLYHTLRENVPVLADLFTTCVKKP